MRDVWIEDIPVVYSLRVASQIAAAVTALPLVDTVTIVVDHFHVPNASPDLRVKILYFRHF